MALNLRWAILWLMRKIILSNVLSNLNLEMWEGKLSWVRPLCCFGPFTQMEMLPLFQQAPFTQSYLIYTRCVWASAKNSVTLNITLEVKTKYTARPRDYEHYRGNSYLNIDINLKQYKNNVYPWVNN